MATKADVLEYSDVIDNLTTVAFAQVKALLLSLDTPNPIEFRDALLATYPELMAPFLSSASEVAAVWYAALRSGAGLSGVAPALVIATVAPQKLDAVVRYSLTPLFKPQEFIGDTILTLLAGATQKLIANAGRDTVIAQSGADRTRVGYARIPRLGCCAFCALMASRGAVYRSRESAEFVRGRGVDASVTAGKRGGQGRGVKTRGSQAVGDKFHNFCRCVVAPVFPGVTNDYVAEAQQFFSDQYAQVGGLVRNSEGRLVTDLKSTLASWREVHGTK